jgi:hypothetical protein
MSTLCVPCLSLAPLPGPEQQKLSSQLLRDIAGGGHSMSFQRVVMYSN